MAIDQINLVKPSYLLDLMLKVIYQEFGQYGDAVGSPLALTYHDLPLFETDIFDPQGSTLFVTHS